MKPGFLLMLLENTKYPKMALAACEWQELSPQISTQPHIWKEIMDLWTTILSYGDICIVSLIQVSFIMEIIEEGISTQIFLL